MGHKKNSGKAGGLSVGPSHNNGGIPGLIKSTGQPIEFEGGEIIINKEASEENCELLSKINQSSGNGVAFNCDKKIDCQDCEVSQKAGVGMLLAQKYAEHRKRTQDEKEAYKKAHGGKEAWEVEAENWKYRSGGHLATKDDKTSQMLNKVRFHLGKGENFMKWKLENKKTDLVEFVDPDKYQLEMTNCRLTNQPKTALKIFNGEMDKSPIAYVECETVKKTKAIKDIDVDERLSYNPKMAPTWLDNEGEIIDNFVFEKLITKGRSVYYDNGKAIYELGGLIEIAKKGTKTQPGPDLFNQPTAGEITEVAKKISKKYLEPDDRILSSKELGIETQRSELLKFIKNPENKTKVIIAFSGGKDSVGLFLHSVYTLGIPKEQIELWHHDVDGGEEAENLWDWPCTRSYCQAFADHFKVPILYSYSKGGITREIYRTNETRQPIYFQKEANGPYFEALPVQQERYIKTKRMFPDVVANLETRWCSSNVKIEVMSRAVTNNERFNNAKMVIMTGERRDESTARAGYSEIEPYKGGYGKSRKAYTWRSVIDFTHDEIWGLMEKHKIQPHPAYMLGWGRCSCQLCIFGCSDTWASLNKISPDKVKKIAQIEKDINYALYNETEKTPTGRYWAKGPHKGKEIMTPGERVDNVYEARVNRGKSFITEANESRWLKEALGTFTSNIIVDKWVTPQGKSSTRQDGAN